jgi:hypothetical protein
MDGMDLMDRMDSEGDAPHPRLAAGARFVSSLLTPLSLLRLLLSSSPPLLLSQ